MGHFSLPAVDYYHAALSQDSACGALDDEAIGSLAVRRVDLGALPEVRNTEYAPDIPYRLTAEEFEALPVPEQTLRARQLILDLQDWMHRLPGAIGPDVYKPVHRFTRGGLYSRELTMPAGLWIVGKRHAVEHLVIVTRGRCTLFTERGREEIVAPMQFVSPAGEKRVLHVHEETTWITVHSTPHRDLDLVEQDLIIPEKRALDFEKALEQA